MNKFTNKTIDLTGKIFGRLKVLEFAGLDKDSRATWKCECGCVDKNIVIVGGKSLRRGLTQSCGCLNKEITSKLFSTHKLSNSIVYEAWQGTKKRCLNINNKCYKNYGGRGITVCPRWLDKEKGFENFLEDMGYPPENTSLDRIDNSGDYCKENCRWATRIEQSHNKRNNNNLELNGETHCITEWGRILGLNHKTIEGRIKKGWPIEKVLSKEDYREVFITYNGKKLSIDDVVKITEINYNTVAYRIRKGWPIDRILNTKLRRKKVSEPAKFP